jgi:hypothetical protein
MLCGWVGSAMSSLDTCIISSLLCCFSSSYSFVRFMIPFSYGMIGGKGPDDFSI